MEFKLSDNQKFNIIWTLLNSRFNEEDGYYIDYNICEIYDEYALVYNRVEGKYERIYYTKNDETDSVALGNREDAYILDVNEEEKRALDMLHTMRDSYEKVDEYVTEIENKVTEYEGKIEEYEVAVSTLQTEKETAESLYTELKNENDASNARIEELTQENEQLTAYKNTAVLEKKNTILSKYAATLEEEVIEQFRAELDDYTEEALEKELAFTLVQSKPAIFATEDKTPKVVPKDDAGRGGIEEILSRYKK